MRFIKRPVAPELVERYRRGGFWKDETCQGVLAQRAVTHADRIALVDNQRCITYRDLFKEVERTAKVFSGLGIGPGDLVTIQLPNYIEFAAAFFAAQQVGAVVSQIGVDFRAREVEAILRLCKTKLFVCPNKYKNFDYPKMIAEIAGEAPSLEFVYVFGDRDQGEVRRIRNGAPQTRPEPWPGMGTADDVTRMGFTSGTTGNPKGVLHSHNTILAAPRICNGDMGITAEDVFLIGLPLGLTWGYLVLLQGILAGARSVLMDGFDPRDALSLIARERVTFVPTAPATIVSMLNVSDRASFDTSSLKIVATGGAACPIEVIREARAKLGGALCEFYGMIETGYHTYTRPTDDPETVSGTIGRPASGMSVRLIDDAGNDVPAGEPGEIAAQGPCVNLGYFRNDEANKLAFTADGWFRTGDVGQFDPSGNLRIVGRVKEIINRGGKKFFPREVEELLYTHHKVLHAAIVGIPDPRLGERNCLCVVPRPGEAISLREMVDHLRDQVAVYKLPEVLEVFEELPSTPTGKVQRPQLARLVFERIAKRS